METVLNIINNVISFIRNIRFRCSCACSSNMENNNGERTPKSPASPLPKKKINRPTPHRLSIQTIYDSDSPKITPPIKPRKNSTIDPKTRRIMNSSDFSKNTGSASNSFSLNLESSRYANTTP